MATEFSATGWNKITLEYLSSVNKLGKPKLQVILYEAKSLVQNSKQDMAGTLMDDSSGRADLCSDPEDNGKNSDYC